MVFTKKNVEEQEAIKKAASGQDQGTVQDLPEFKEQEATISEDVKILGSYIVILISSLNTIAKCQEKTVEFIEGIRNGEVIINVREGG